MNDIGGCAVEMVIYLVRSFGSLNECFRINERTCVANFARAKVMLKAFSEALRVSLRRFFCPPRERLQCWSSPYSSFFGSQWSDMQTTWPAQL